MNIQDIAENEKEDYNRVVGHPLQSFQWGEFRKKTGVTVIRKGFFKNSKLSSGFQLTIHKIPKTSWNIGYLAKGDMPNEEDLTELVKIGRENKCIFIQLEPNVKKNQNSEFKIQNSTFLILNSQHPLFTKYTFALDLTKSEEDLLKGMHPKTRYNIRVAEKHNVVVKEETSDEAFAEYLSLTKETTSRQGFYAHTENYHKLMWETLRIKDLRLKINDSHDLAAHLLIAYYQNKPLVTWILFTFHDTLYYPYGASSSQHRETMASNLMMWETIKFGKKSGLKMFDLWGALGPEPDPKDPWYGFHRFKQGYGPELVEFIGSYDLIINKPLYQLYKLADKARWSYLRLKKS